jgi:hypothetical protein
MSSTAGLIAQTGMMNTALSSPSYTKNSEWIIDTGANDHMTCDSSNFSFFIPFTFYLSYY